MQMVSCAKCASLRVAGAVDWRGLQSGAKSRGDSTEDAISWASLCLADAVLRHVVVEALWKAPLGVLIGLKENMFGSDDW